MARDDRALIAALAATGAEVAVVRDQANDDMLRLVFSPDGKTLLLSGSETVELWSVAELLKRKPE